jgi:wyosine [tRNA(Phe)-imidazoG37] synthetase (radical SAM superfamily)
MEVKRIPFYGAEEIAREVAGKVEKTRAIGKTIDYLTFVADGEPTLDANLGQEIELLQPLGIRVAVISNGSLMPLEDVREDLMKADWVSLKVDSTREEVWRRINRPHRTLQLAVILDGMLEFAKAFQGELVTETMLAQGVNDESGHLAEIAEFLARLQPATSYLAIPTRPPAEKRVVPPAEKDINKAYQIFSERFSKVEYLIGYEGDDFTLSGNPAEDILSITAVHPMREDAVKKLLLQEKADWSLIERLLDEGDLIETVYRGKRFYLRRLPSTGAQH